MNNEIEKYMNQDLCNPTFLFSGRDHLLNKLAPNKAFDSTGNKTNEEVAVYLSSSFLIATAYAFRSNVCSTNFTIGNISVTMEENIDDDIFGYVYVFLKDNNCVCTRPSRSVQYKCYQEMKPIDIIKVRYGDFKELYDVKNTKKL